ncbi:amidohydrolase [Rhodovulum sp. 12E13]|nr:amidohydrolase [Rhodovulum sp. 12E13]
MDARAVTAMLPARSVRLAAACYPVEALAGWDSLADKLGGWIADAAREGAEIAVLPEYAGLEAAFALSRETTTAGWCEASAAAAGRYAALCATLAHDHRLTLLAGSLPARAHGRLVNRAFLCRPDGQVIAQDKQILTPWERAETPLAPGVPLIAVDTGLGRLATLVCYDSEFPPLARALVPDILLIPSCTEAPAGDARVRAAARARALEGQCVTVHAPLTGAVRACEIVDANTGAAGIFGPPDRHFPDDGVLALGETDRPGWVVADLPEGALSATRTEGAVAPRAHMKEAEARAAEATLRPVGRPGPQLGP